MKRIPAVQGPQAASSACWQTVTRQGLHKRIQKSMVRFIMLCLEKSTNYLVGGLEPFLFSHILGIIIPID